MGTFVIERCPSPTKSITSDEDELLLLELDELREQKPIEQLTTARLLLLTCPSLGLQVCWFLLQSRGTPYLRSLGIQGSSVSLAWALGPIFGAFLQPILGQLSDDVHHPFFRRKPFMMVGAFTVILSTFALSRAQELTALLITEPATNSWPHRALAIICLVATLFALCVYSIGVRAIVVDNCPPEQQFAAAAWSMRWNVAGSAMLSTAGFFFAPYHDRQSDPVLAFRTLTDVAAVCSAVTVGLVCWFTPRETPPALHSQTSGIAQFLAMFLPSELLRRWRHLPALTKKVCNIQLSAWTGWFPVLYYMSTYAYETALFRTSALPTDHLEPPVSPESHAKSYPLYASLFFSFGTLVSTTLLVVLDATLFPKIPLPRVWFASQILAVTSLFLTILLCGAHSALVLISLLGATWAVTMWVPFALINNELAELRSSVAGVQGMHNMAVSLPQIASALVCAAVLAGLDMMGVERGAVWLMRLAAVPVAWSAWLIWQLDGA